MISKIALIGMGAIGGYLAGTLQDFYGDDFYVVAGGARASKLRNEGLLINGKQQYFNVHTPEETETTVDLVILITKLGALAQACDDIKNYVGPNTLIMCPLNGVESEDVVGEIFGYDNLIYSLTRASVVKEGNRISFNPNNSFLEIGERKAGPASDRVQQVKTALEKGGVKCQVQEDMIKAIWEKYVCNVGENQVAAVLGLNFGAWWKSDHANFLRVQTSNEVIAVARAKGIMIDENYAVEHRNRLHKLPEANKASTLQDIEHGRRTEVEMFAGTMIKYGKELGIETPYNEFLYHAIKTLEEKNEGKICYEGNAV